tara:strand:+ start:3244 stop:3726 length:483 start_codon:yes stop_codon:yes gene_type:complete
MSYSKTFFDSNGIKNVKELGVREFFNNINGNKLFLGLMMIFMNLGSRYIEIKLTKGQEMMLKNIAREVLIFTIAFMGSRDIFISLIITAVFIILTNFVFNENSKFCVLPEKYKKLANIIDTNNDGEVSREELEKAYEVLRKAREQDQLTNKINMLSNISE